MTGLTMEPLLLRIILDFICLCIVGIPILIFKFAGTPHKQGFYCDDISLQRPYHDSTISSDWLFTVGVFLPFFSMVGGEWLHYRYQKSIGTSDAALVGGHKPGAVLGHQVHPYLWNLYKVAGVFLFGACVSQFTTDIAKYGVGRLRPHFLDVCQPVMNPDLCLERSATTGLAVARYVRPGEVKCEGSDDARIKEARLSFPSGHASFSCFTMLYLAMYMQVRMTWRRGWLVKHVLQVFVLYLSLYTCLSRVSDNKHHWSDVLAGIGFGVVVAVLVFFTVSDLPREFRRQRRKQEQAEESGREDVELGRAAAAGEAGGAA